MSSFHDDDREVKGESEDQKKESGNVIEDQSSGMIEVISENNKKLIEKVRNDPIAYRSLSEEQRENPKILQMAIKRNENGEYADFSFKFVKDEETETEKEIEDLKRQQELLKKLFIEHSKNPNLMKFEYFRKLGKGSFGRTYLIRIIINQELNVQKNSTSEYFSNEFDSMVFVLKLTNEFSDETRSLKVHRRRIDRDSLYLPYHRNVAPVLFHDYEFPIDLQKLPDFEEFWKEIVDPQLYFQKRGVILLKYHRKDLEKYVEERVDFHKPFQNHEFCYLLLGVLKGAKHLHSHFIVHRDLYPNNIFIDEAYGRVWIGDFGCCLDLRNRKHEKEPFKVPKTEDILFFGSSSDKYLIRGGYFSRYNEKFLAPEIHKFDPEKDEFLDYSKSDLYSIGMIGKFIILSFYNHKIDLESVSDKFLSEEITKVIQELLMEEPSKRIGFDDSIEEFERLTSFFEEERGKLSFDFSDPQTEEKSEEDLENMWKKYIWEGENLYQFGKYSQSIKSYLECLQILEEHFPQNHLYIFVCYYKIGFAKELLSEYSSSLEYLQKSLNILLDHFDENYEQISSCYGMIGTVYMRLQEFDLSKKNLENGLQILQKHLPENQKDFASSYGDLASLYDEMKDYSTSLKFYQKSLKIQEEIIQMKNPKELIRIDKTFGNIAILFGKQQNYSESLKYLQKCLEFQLQHLPKNHPDISSSYHNLGVHYFELKDYEKSLEYYLKSLKIKEKNFPPKHQKLIEEYSNIGDKYFLLKNYSKALEYFEKGLPFLQEDFDKVKEIIQKEQKKKK